MSANAVVLANLGTGRWNTRVYGSLSIASRIASIVKDRRAAIHLAILLGRLNRQLVLFFEEIYQRIEGTIPIDTTAKTLTPDEVQSALRSLRELGASLFEVYQVAKGKRLTNNSLLAGSFSRLRTYSEDISELADWLEMSLESKSVEDIFERSQKEAKEGDIFDIKQAF